jgi:hypothetical protein
MRVLIVASQPPIPTGGGAMLLHRHFCERKDFKVGVVTDNPSIKEHEVHFPYLYLDKPTAWKRLTRTRFSRDLHSIAHLTWGYQVPQKVMEFAKGFNPDIVFTVAGNWSWTATLARQIANRLDIPLAASFMDWWNYSQIYANWADPHIAKKYQTFYKNCDLALCISDGMKNAMGPHANAVVIHPIGTAAADNTALPKQSNEQSNEQFKFFEKGTCSVAFGGNLNGWYGDMIRSLMRASATVPDISLKVYGFDDNWEDEFRLWASEQGMYGGFMPISRLRNHLKQADALFLLMGFDKTCEIVEKTNFKSKFIEYLSFQKPIFMWGPEYSSTIQYAKKFDAAEVCTSADPQDFLSVICKTMANRQIHSAR